MKRALSWKVRLEKLHLVTQDASTLEVNIFRMGWHEGNGQKLHAGLLGCSTGFVIVATLASGHHISPKIETSLTQRFDMITREIGVAELITAVEA